MTSVFATSDAAFLAARTHLLLFLAYLVARFIDKRPYPLGFGSSGASPCGRRAHACSGASRVLRGEYIVGREELLRGDGQGADSVPKDNLFPRDPSRQTRPSSSPLSSLDPASVVPIVFPGAVIGSFDSPEYVRPTTWHRVSYT